MEADDDEFGELYCDVLQPLSSLPSTTNKLAEQNLMYEKRGSCSTSPGDSRCPVEEVGGLKDAEKEVQGTVRLEIYLGSRRVLKNNFVFSLTGQVVQGENNSEYNQSGNLVTGDVRDELNSVQGFLNHSQCERSESIVACVDGRELRSEPEKEQQPDSQSNQTERIGIHEVGDSNSNPELEVLNGKSLGIPECHGIDISLDAALRDGKINQDDNLMDEASNFKMKEIGTLTGAEPCRGEPAEEGELSECAQLDFIGGMVTVATASNSTEAGIKGDRPQHIPYSFPAKNARHVGATTFGEAMMPRSTTTSTIFPYKAGVMPRPLGPRYPYLSVSVFDLDMDHLEHTPWRHPSVNISDYFNYGLTESSWKSYCEDIKTLRRYNGKRIQVDSGERGSLPSAKAIPQRPRDSTASIQDKPFPFGLREETKCYPAPVLEKTEEGSCGNVQGKQDIYPATASRKIDENAIPDSSSKRAKNVEESSRDSSSNMSDNEWMCRNVGIDSWFHPITMPQKHAVKHQESRRKGSRKGRSKLERWTRIDRDNDDENTSTSSP